MHYYINSEGNQMYPYTNHLLALEANRPVVPRPTPMVGTIITLITETPPR